MPIVLDSQHWYIIYSGGKCKLSAAKPFLKGDTVKGTKTNEEKKNNKTNKKKNYLHSAPLKSI